MSTQVSRIDRKKKSGNCWFDFKFKPAPSNLSEKELERLFRRYVDAIASTCVYAQPTPEDELKLKNRSWFQINRDVNDGMQLARSILSWMAELNDVSWLAWRRLENKFRDKLRTRIKDYIEIHTREGFEEMIEKKKKAIIKQKDNEVDRQIKRLEEEIWVNNVEAPVFDDPPDRKLPDTFQEYHKQIKEKQEQKKKGLPPEVPHLDLLKKWYEDTYGKSNKKIKNINKKYTKTAKICSKVFHGNVLNQGNSINRFLDMYFDPIFHIDRDDYFPLVKQNFTSPEFLKQRTDRERFFKKLAL
jgi:hypothetical protein